MFYRRRMSNPPSIFAYPLYKAQNSIVKERDSYCFPESYLTGTVHLNNAKVLSIPELQLTFYGPAHRHIFRRHSTYSAFAIVDWSGHELLFYRIILLIDGATTLSPGEHDFKIAIQVPESSEPMTENYYRCHARLRSVATPQASILGNIPHC